MKKLEEVCDFQNGFAFKSDRFSETGSPILRISNIQSEEIETRKLVYFNPSDYKENLDKYRVAKGDLLIAMSGATTGKIGFNSTDQQFYLNQRVGKFEPKQCLLKNYLFFFLSTMVEECLRISAGSAQPNLSTEQIKGFDIPIPPLDEQHRIVSVLHDAFACLATAQVNTEKNLHNARALFESHLQSVFTQRGNGWVERKLGAVAEFKNGLNFTRQSKGQTIQIVGVGDFQDHAVVPIDTLQSVTIDGNLSDDYLIRRDDILTVRSNGSKDLVGRCMIVPDVDGMTSYSGFIIRIRFDTREICPRFLLRFMKSSETRKRLTRDGGGANISNINQAKLSELPVSLPPFPRQEEIADQLDLLATETQRLEHLYMQKLAALSALKKSLLHQAFSGQL